MVELNARLSRVKLKDSDHSDILFDKLAEVNIAYSCQLDETRYISIIMAVTPKHYTNTLPNTEGIVEVKK